MKETTACSISCAGSAWKIVGKPKAHNKEQSVIGLLNLKY
jgi:hypothetical protein